jgi:hypothetical protein
LLYIVACTVELILFMVNIFEHGGCDVVYIKTNIEYNFDMCVVKCEMFIAGETNVLL